MYGAASGRLLSQGKPMRILVADGDERTRRGVSEMLKRMGHQVAAYAAGDEANAALASGAFGLAVLDDRLPEIGGLKILRAVREQQNGASVVLLCSDNAPAFRSWALDMGADDCLSRPFDINELGSRVRAVVRRRLGAAATTIAIGPLELNMNTRTVRGPDGWVYFTSREFLVLEYLAANLGGIATKSALLDLLGRESGPSTQNAAELYISRVRKRLFPFDVALTTVRGVGYCLEA